MARKPAAADEPAQRRKPGTGTIRHKPGREKPWEAGFPIGRDDYRYDSFATRAEAAAHLDKLTTERDQEQRDVAGGSQRVEAFLVDFLNRKAPHVKRKTLADYTYQCGLAGEYLGNLRVDEVTRKHADEMLLHYHRNGYQNGDQLRMVCRQAFQYALDEDSIKKNPFDKASAPPVERAKTKALSGPQLSRLLDTARDTWLEPLWHFYGRLALREGEGLGLRWADVDMDAGTAVIIQQYTAVKGKVYKETPKTPKSRRTIPIPDDMLDLLRMHYRAQRAYAAQADEWHEHGLVFPSHVGTPIPPRNLVRTFKALLKDAELPTSYTVHGLRHTALFHLEQAGVPESTRMALGGHSTAAMAKHYSDHATIEDVRAALKGSERGGERGGQEKSPKRAGRSEAL